MRTSNILLSTVLQNIPNWRLLLVSTSHPRKSLLLPTTSSSKKSATNAVSCQFQRDPATCLLFFCHGTSATCCRDTLLNATCHLLPDVTCHLLLNSQAELLLTSCCPCCQPWSTQGRLQTSPWKIIFMLYYCGCQEATATCNSGIVSICLSDLDISCSCHILMLPLLMLLADIWCRLYWCCHCCCHVNATGCRHCCCQLMLPCQCYLMLPCQCYLMPPLLLPIDAAMPMLLDAAIVAAMSMLLDAAIVAANWCCHVNAT